MPDRKTTLREVTLIRPGVKSAPLQYRCRALMRISEWFYVLFFLFFPITQATSVATRSRGLKNTAGSAKPPPPLSYVFNACLGTTL